MPCDKTTIHVQNDVVGQKTMADGSYMPIFRDEVPGLLAEIERLRATSAKRWAVVQAADALLLDVRRRYPGEELRCEFMRALDGAISNAL